MWNGNGAVARAVNGRENTAGACTRTMATVDGSAAPLRRIAAMIGDHAEAARQLDLALETHRRMRAPYWTPRKR